MSGHGSRRAARADLAVRGLLVVAVAAASVWLDLRLPLLLVAAAVLAAWNLPTAVLAWMALTAPLFVPLYGMRHAAVYFGTAYLTLLLAFLAVDLALRRRSWMAPSRCNVPLLLLAVFAVLAAVQGAEYYDPSVPGVHHFALVQVYAAALVVLPAGAALLVANAIDSPRDLMLAHVVVVAVGAYLIVGPILLPQLPKPGWTPMIVSQAVALLYAMLLHGRPRSFWLRSLGAALVLYALVEILALPLLRADQGQWISGWLGVSIPLALITLVRFPRTSVLVLGPATAALAWAKLPLLVDVVNHARSEGDFGRLLIWADALHLAAMRPLLGVGPGNYSDYVERYATTMPYGSAHGNYQQILAEMGGLGLAALLWVLAAALWTAWRQYRRSADPWRRAFALGALGAISGQAAAATVGDYLIPAYHNGGHTTVCVSLYVWMLIGALMAAERQPEVQPAAPGASAGSIKARADPDRP